RGAAHRAEREAARAVHVDQPVRHRRCVRQQAQPAKRVHLLVLSDRAARHAGTADAVEAVAAGNEVAHDLLAHAVLLVGDARPRIVEFVQRDVRGLVHGRQVGGAARVHQIARQLCLAVDGHALAPGEALHVDAATVTAPEHLEPAMHQPLAVHARPDAGLVQQIDANLLEDPGADPAEYVLAGLALQDHGVDAGLSQQLPEQQARRAGTNDRDLRPRARRHAGSIPWRRFASAAAGAAMNSSSTRAPSGSRARTLTAAENVVTIWMDGGSDPTMSIPPTCINSDSCWKPSATSPRATSAPTGTPGGGVTIRRRSSSAMPQRSNSFASATPPGPVEYPTVRAATTVRLSASSLSIRGRGFPAGTATATPALTRSTTLPSTRCPPSISLSMVSRARATTSNASPAATRFAASTPPTDSIATPHPVRTSKARASSASTALVAIDEIPVTVTPGPPSTRRATGPGSPCPREARGSKTHAPRARVRGRSSAPSTRGPGARAAPRAPAPARPPRPSSGSRWTAPGRGPVPAPPSARRATARGGSTRESGASLAPVCRCP